MNKFLLTLLTLNLIFFTNRIEAQDTKPEEKEEEKEVILESYPNDHEFYKFYKVDSVEYSLSTPYHALHTHLDFLEEQNFHPEISAKVFSTSVGKLEKRIDLAEELELVFIGRGIYINQLDVPLEKDYIEKNTGRKRFIVSKKLPDIYLIKVNGYWRYSNYSARKIHKIFKATFPSYSRNVIKYLSKIEWGNRHILGLKIWQWLLTAAIFAGLYFVYYIIIWVLTFIIKTFFTKEGNQYFISILISKLKRPVTIGILTLMFWGLIPLLLLNSDIAFGLNVICKVVVGLCIVIFIFRTSDLIVLKVMTPNINSTKRRFNIDAHLTPVLKSSLRIVALMIGFLVFLKLLGYNINNIVTGISFGGLIIAFAAQDTVKNFIGSIMLLLDKPFSVGDNIVVKGKSGVVEEIGFRTTKIRTFNDSLVSLPNNLAADNDVDNLGKRVSRRFNTMLGIEYGTPRENVRKFIKGIRQAIEDHPTTKKEGYQVRLYQFSASSIDILLNVFFQTDDYNIELESREELMFTIMEIADATNVSFAFPSQTVYFNDHEKEPPSFYNPKKKNDKEGEVLHEDDEKNEDIDGENVD